MTSLNVPEIPEFSVVPLEDMNYRRRPRSWPAHLWHARHHADEDIAVTAATEAKLRAACDGVALAPSWLLALRQAGKSQRTIEGYLQAVCTLATYLADRGLPTDSEDVTTEQIREFLLHWKTDHSLTRAASFYRSLSVFFRWCVSEGEFDTNPMDRVEQINVPEKAQPILTAEEVAALLKVCSGSDFESRRDTAIIRILVDNGVRVGGLAGLRYKPDDEKINDVYLAQFAIRVTLKGGREFFAPIGTKAAAALDRYIRARKKHPAAAVSDWLWLPLRSRPDGNGEIRLNAQGIMQMLDRRAAQAGLAKANPHKFRRSFAVQWEGDITHLMRIGGWQSLEMARHYGRQGEELKARKAHRENSPGDKI